MAKNGKIFDENGNLIYPLTVSTEVKDPTSGKSVKEQIDEINNKIVDEIGPKCDQLAEIVGGVEYKRTFDLASGGTWTDDKGILSAAAGSTYEGEPSGSSGNSFIKIDVSAYAGKTLNYSRGVYTSSTIYGMCFYSSTGVSKSSVIASAGERVVINAEELGYEASSIAIPSNAKIAAITFPTSLKESFYATVTTTTTSEGLQKDVEDLQENGALLYSASASGSSIFTVGRYVSKSGTIVTHADYAYTDYIKIMVKKDIPLIACQSGNQYMALIAFYDADKNFISCLSNVGSSQEADYTVSASDIPKDAVYFRVSSSKAAVNAAITYIDYSVTSKEWIEKQDGENIPSRVSVLESKEESAHPVVFNSFRGNATLEAGGVMTLANNHIATNILFVARIEGTIEQVSIGQGYSTNSTYYYRAYGASWLTITQTEVKLYRAYNSAWQLKNTYTHGLTLTDKTIVTVSTSLADDGTETFLLKISNDKGDVFEQTLTQWGIGGAFATNDNSSDSLIIDLSMFPKDITKNVWIFGDSYFSHWLQYVYAIGATRWLRNSQPGLSPTAGVTDFQNLLTLGYKPAFAVYCLGMNGDTAETKTDGEYVISSSQKTYIDNFISICSANNITPILTCVPTVPTRKKTGFRTYIKSLNVRYIDWYEAVGADEYGIWHGSPTLQGWTDGTTNVYTRIKGSSSTAVGDPLFDANGDILSYTIDAIDTDNNTITANSITFSRDTTLDMTGLLSTDGVHPTTAGAKVIAARVMLDFPEIAVCE